MSASRRGLKAIIKKIEHGAERSSLFWYMLDHHDEFARAATGTRIRWAPLCEQFAADGLLDGEGKAPTPANARITWWNVRREVAKRRAASSAEPPVKLQPSRMPATWRPPVAEPGRPAEPPRAPAVPRAELPSRTGTSLLNAEDLPEDVRENLAALERQFAWADRYVNPPKKED